MRSLPPVAAFSPAPPLPLFRGLPAVQAFTCRAGACWFPYRMGDLSVAFFEFGS